MYFGKQCDLDVCVFLMYCDPSTLQLNQAYSHEMGEKREWVQRGLLQYPVFLSDMLKNNHMENIPDIKSRAQVS